MIRFKHFIVEKVIEVEHEFDGGKTVKVHHNPSASEAKSLSDKGHVRGTHTKHGVFMWHSDDAIHYHVRKSLKDHHGMDVSDSKQSGSEEHRDFSLHNVDHGGKNEKHLYVQRNYQDKSDGDRHAAHKEAILKHPSFKKLQPDRVLS